MKAFENRLGDKLAKFLSEDNDVKEMSSKEYAHGAEEASMTPNQGTVRGKAAKTLAGSRPSGAKMEQMSGTSSKNTEKSTAAESKEKDGQTISESVGVAPFSKRLGSVLE